MIGFTCPGCNKKLQVKEESAGKKIKCPKCGEIARVPLPAPVEEDIEDAIIEEPPPKPVRGKSPPPKARPRDEDADDEDFEPVRSRKSDRDKPATRRPRVAEEDDEWDDEVDEDFPRVRKSGKPTGAAGKPLVIWRMFAVLFLAAGLGAGGLGIFLYYRDIDNHKSNEKVLTDKKAFLADLQKIARDKKGPEAMMAKLRADGMGMELSTLTKEHDEGKQKIESYMMMAAGGAGSTVVGVGFTVFYALRLRRWKKQQVRDDFDEE